MSSCSNLFGAAHIRSLLRQSPTAMREGKGWGEQLGSVLSPGSSELGRLLLRLLQQRMLAIKKHKHGMDLNNCVLAYVQVVHNNYLQIRRLFRHQHNFIFGR